MGAVTLHNGQEVDSWSEAWRHECECRFICTMPTLRMRRDMLAGIEKFRGIEERRRVERTMRELWPKLRGDNDNGRNDGA